MTVDGLGNPLRLQLTGGERHDIIKAYDLIAGLDFGYVLADRGYSVQEFIEAIEAGGAEAVIPPKKNAKTPREYDAWRYQERHLVECFIGKIKHFRRVFSRFDKLANRYLGFVQFVSALIWLR